MAKKNILILRFINTYDNNFCKSKEFRTKILILLTLISSWYRKCVKYPSLAMIRCKRSCFHKQYSCEARLYFCHLVRYFLWENILSEFQRAFRACWRSFLIANKLLRFQIGSVFLQFISIHVNLYMYVGRYPIKIQLQNTKYKANLQANC